LLIIAGWVLATCSVALAHIGSPNVYFEGNAGAYPVRVSVMPPEVVPGRAQINVRVLAGEATRVTALPVRWDAGRKGSPAPDPALPVQGETNLFSTELWLMDSGAYSVFVDIEGNRGKGTAIVPVNSVATRRLSMPAWMGAVFFISGVGLVTLLIIVIGAAARESVLAPGSPVNPARARRARYAMAVATVVLVMALLRGNAWWNEVDAQFRNNRLFQTVQVESRIVERDGKPLISIALENPENGWRDTSPLVADHGKLMHLFMVEAYHQNAFAHLHPAQVEPGTFECALPPCPPGDYVLYADVTRESGLEQTYVSRLRVEQSAARKEKFDPDDSWWILESEQQVASGPERRAELAGRGTLRALSPLSVTARDDQTLRFDAVGPDGQPLPLEPYLGMWSHAVVRAEDGSVFTHIHPAGTISMTAQELFARRERGESLRKPIDVVCGRPERELTFPYAFPQPGKYRVWVQIKSLNEILTGAFDFEVLPPRT
jgi:hypothetical protein